MSAIRAYRRAGLLRYAAVQFVLLTACAMAAYAGGTWFDPWAPRYELSGNFLSDLGAIHAFSGRTNYLASALFSVALATMGAALVAFAWAWRGFAFERNRARWVGHASSVLGTLSGTAFVGVAVAPFDVVLTVHNTLVIAAFGLLALYIVAITVVMWRNSVGGARLVANAVYLVLVVAYISVVVFGPRFDTVHGHAVQVIAQKVVVYGSMLHVLFLTTITRRSLAASHVIG
jgi:hypothetical protein